jgi:hypothetical protein
MGLEDKVNELFREADDRDRDGSTRLSEKQVPPDTIAKSKPLNEP